MTELHFDAVILAGGRSRRMHVPDKTRLLVTGVSMLDHVLAAVTSAVQVIVVGDCRAVAREVTWTREDPPGGGPAIATAAGLKHVTADIVVVAAGDLPLLTTGDINELVASLTGDGIAYVDNNHQVQWLCSAWHTDALRRRPAAAGQSMGGWLSDLQITTLPAPPSITDCDTPEALKRARSAK